MELLSILPVLRCSAFDTFDIYDVMFVDAQGIFVGCLMLVMSCMGHG
jgi:hypothetical protein